MHSIARQKSDSRLTLSTTSKVSETKAVAFDDVSKETAAWCMDALSHFSGLSNIRHKVTMRPTEDVSLRFQVVAVDVLQ